MSSIVRQNEGMLFTTTVSLNNCLLCGIYNSMFLCRNKRNERKNNRRFNITCENKGRYKLIQWKS